MPMHPYSCLLRFLHLSAIQNRGFGCGLTQNRMLVVTVAISFLSQLGLIYIAFMQAIFQTEALRFRRPALALCAWGNVVCAARGP
ncbi:hypothetical protein EI94DRAFT_714921 [Lactarius quietus]|nr:hypothetical protein EI94DRAFT_714921 [Lactarius quietus]